MVHIRLHVTVRDSTRSNPTDPIKNHNLRYYDNFVANFLSSPTVNTLWKSANIWQSHERIKSWMIFLIHSVSGKPKRGVLCTRFVLLLLVYFLRLFQW